MRHLAASVLAVVFLIVRQAGADCADDAAGLRKVAAETEATDLSAADNLPFWRERAELLQKAGAGLAACSPESSKAALDASENLASRLRQETACRASDTCMLGRVCDAIFTRDEDAAEVERLKQEIATERGNPAGVVDLELLHTLGNGLRQAQGELAASIAELATARAMFTKVRRKPVPACPVKP